MPAFPEVASIASEGPTSRNPLAFKHYDAAAMRADGRIERMVRGRYVSWDRGLGAGIEAGKHSLAFLDALMLDKGEASPNASGRQELFENVVNEYL